MTFAPEPAPGSLVVAAQWIEELVQGPLAVTFALLAIGATGFMMLNGRLAIRRGFAVTLGCFILFGAPVIARGIMGSAIASTGIFTVSPSPPIAAVDPSISPPPTATPTVADPYAGASISQ